MQFLLKYRFSYIDLLWIGILTFLMAEGEILYSIIVLLVGSAITVSLEMKFTPYRHNKNAKWEELARNGKRVEAIKEYRNVYGATLKEALDKVEEFLNHEKTKEV